MNTSTVRALPLRPLEPRGEQINGLVFSVFFCSRIFARVHTLRVHSRSERPPHPFITPPFCLTMRIAKRLRKNPKLKSWFNELKDAERQAWYNKHTRLSERQPNCKRDFETELVTTAELSTGAEKRRRVWWKPYSVWEKEERMKAPTMTEAELAQKLRLALMGTEEKMNIDGEWHLKEYQGIVEDEVDSAMQRRSVTQTSSCTTESAVFDGIARQHRDMDQLRADRLAHRPPDAAKKAAPACPDSFVAGVVEDRRAAMELGDEGRDPCTLR